MHTIAGMVKLKVEIDYVIYFMFGFSYFVKNYKTYPLWYRSVYNSIMYMSVYNSIMYRSVYNSIMYRSVYNSIMYRSVYNSIM
jgi:hypothetical protein